jgi:hypothetical protein
VLVLILDSLRHAASEIEAARARLSLSQQDGSCG